MQPASRRPYHSPRREAAARATRKAVLAAADGLFVSRGYAATTLAAVADAAEVSLATVKLVAPTKAGLLLEVLKGRARGDAGGETISERPWWREMLSEKDAAALLSRWVALTRSVHQRQAALFEVVWQAAPSETEIAEVERRGSASRREDFRAVIEALAGLGALRRELDVDTGVDIAWVLNSPLVYRLFARCGWTPDRWEIWLTETLAGQLLNSAYHPSSRSGLTDSSS